MKTKLFTFFLVLACATGFYSCSDDDDVMKTEVTVAMENPDNLEDLSFTGGWVVTFTERNTGKSYSAESTTNTLSITVPEGDYKIQGEAPVTYSFAGSTQKGILYFSQESKVVVGEAVSVSVTSFPKTEYAGENGGFVIQEIFYTGSATPEGKQYSGDKYIKLYNNTDQTLYADGLFLASTQRNTGTTYTYTPEVLGTHVPVDGIIIIPGDGTQYPVEPGKSFILAESAVDHKKGNTNSFDLSNANMEWVNELLINQPANNPNVPDAIPFYESFILHNSGLSSIILGRIEVSTDKFLTDYVYEYTWKTIINGTEYERGPFNEYKIPNEWVMDAVYTSVEGKALVPVFSPSIDMGWAYCGTYFGDKDRYGKSVIRKILSTTADGRDVLQDTNNSAVDFISNATPSLAK